MKRVLFALAGAALVAIVVFVGIALGSTGGTRGAAARSPITIIGLISEKVSGYTFRGPFTVTLNGVNEDSGTAFIDPQVGPDKNVGGLVQEQVSANVSLRSKKGILSFSVRGVALVVHNISPTKFPLSDEYGTWQINEGTGIYKGWKGGGRYAVASTTPRVNDVEWGGYVTH